MPVSTRVNREETVDPKPANTATKPTHKNAATMPYSNAVTARRSDRRRSKTAGILTTRAFLLSRRFRQDVLKIATFFIYMSGYVHRTDS